MKIDDTQLSHSLAPDPTKAAETKKVAREFEAIFLRKMLSGMEKTTSLTGKSPGASMYGQMVTDALADSLSASGGIGLAANLEKTLVEKK